MSSESLDVIGLKYAYNFATGKNYTGGDKTSIGNNFTKEYALLFDPIRTKKIILLELGVLCGKSLAMWSDYFSNGLIYGIDVDIKQYYNNEKDLRRHGGLLNNNVKIIEQNILDDSFKTLIGTLPHFDIMIDDALHIAKVQFDNFMLLFPRLNGGGYYIIEDVIDPIGFITYFKDIYMCVSNPESSKIKKNLCYSISNKIELIQIKQNMIIIKRKL